jgi:hypothetical protein
MSKTWKQSESKIGIYYGAKGILKSGRQPLSGGNSGVTRGDSPHSSIFIESKRDKKYHSAIKLWREYKKINKKRLFVVSLPIVQDKKIISRNSDIWCIHNLDFENISLALRNGFSFDIMPWKGNYPSVLTLYKESLSIKNSSILDRDKELVTCNVVYHGHKGFWIIINKNDICRCWELIKLERNNRDKLLKKEGL